MDIDRGLYVVRGDSAAPKFKRLYGSLGWLNPKGQGDEALHALVVGGEQEDGRNRVILEHQGDAYDMTQALVDVKDALLVETFWCDGANEEVVSQLRQVDGLCYYQNFGRDKVNRVLWAQPHPREVWKYFRSNRPTAAICPVPDRVRVDIQGGLDRLVRLDRSKQLIITKSLQQCFWVFGQNRNEIEEHPVARALIWLAWAMEELKAPEKTKEQEPFIAYPNRPDVR
jgi:hypothetical protein